MSDDTKTLLQQQPAVVVDVGKPGTCGYNPGRAGKIVGVIVELNDPIYFSWGREEDTTRYVLVSPKEIRSDECSQGTLTS
jgi:hypothetical protein